MAGGVFDAANVEVLCFANCVGSDGWRLTTPLPEALIMRSGATFNGHFRVFGGSNGDSKNSDGGSKKVLVWYPEEEKWRTDAPLLNSTVNGAAVTVATKAFCKLT